MSQLLDTHFYDGKLHVHDLLEQVKVVNVPTPTKRELFDKLVNDIRAVPTIRSRIINSAISAVNLVSQSIGTGANFDTSNGIYADNVLYLICKQDLDPEFMPCLVEQLSDIVMSGQCPQGRCTRLFQILSTLQ